MESAAETLTDGEVVLRRWHAGQGDTLAAVVGDSIEHLGAWMIWATGGYTREDASEFLALTRTRWETGESFEYAVFAPGGELAGGCGLMTRDGGREIGYWLSRHFTGRGLITRTVSALVAESFRLGAGYVEIKHDELNTRSGAVPARLGFTLVRKEKSELPLAPSCNGVTVVWRLDAPVVP